ncbi:Serine/threonine protein kinase/TGF-beta stimulated factor [Handroanthus impetiginosus]|uniref:Serine/threonine protein kinase/TGF-beta stimulated factor n=1 Tax=Handroanthus impetiginosus TaxID=429701 RepID=A0A2G9H6E7_9LAMI|nr:Serine/threonine protein kinase/TGF-beta stimulated factor [Handroanthus impetiginosus]
MSAIYDNWERLVAAVLKREQLWQLFHAQSTSPSVLWEASDFSSSFSLGSPLPDLAFELSSLGSSSRSRRAPPKLVVISDFSPAINVNNLHRASTKLLGRGAYGSTCMVVMDNGVKIVVKRLKSGSISEPDFKRHVDVVGNVRHENVAALRAYYSSKNERVMLYDYFMKGSVHALLHGRTDESRAHVDVETRVTIAIGTARGIAEIHTQNGGKLVHGNIKSSNILLSGQQYGCASDLGLASMIDTTFTPTARCYAPEAKRTRNMSQASDVYSFGILLFELLTRKSTTHLPGILSVNLHVGSVKSKAGTAKVFDEDLLKHPTINHVKRILLGVKPESHGPFGKELTFVENPNPTFGLEDMLRATGWMIGKGTFGYSYKAILENGNPIVVKRTFGSTEVIGRMRHENVAELRTYHFSSNDKYLVYDYYNQDSLAALLCGNDEHKVHGNIKSLNIFVNEKKYDIVSDVGLAKLIGPIRLSENLDSLLD